MTEQPPDRTLFYSLRAKGINTAFVEGLDGLQNSTVTRSVTKPESNREYSTSQDRKTAILRLGQEPTNEQPVLMWGVISPIFNLTGNTA